MSVVRAITRAPARGALVLMLSLVCVTEAHAEREPTRAVAGVGVAVPVVNHALYDAGILARGGADFPLRGGETYRLRVLGQWLGFGAAGARADVGAVQASLRMYPLGGLFLELGTGGLLEVERLRVILPTRAVDESRTRFGVPASIAVGFGLFRTIELEAGYQQIVFVRDLPATVGIAHLSLGGRL